jgi:hypothetical protein
MKKNIPLVVLETLEKFVQLKGEQFDVIHPEKFLVKIVDKDNDSDFYFHIESYKVENGLKLQIDWKPVNKESIGNKKMWIEGKELDAYFSNWIKLLKAYETVNSFFDDPIIKSFTEEYYAEFEIIDEDAESRPLTSKQILLLDDHLEYIENNIEKYQTEQNEAEIQEIKNSIQELRGKLTSKSKAWVIKNLANIWAKVTKQGTRLLKDFLSEAKKQVIREGVKYLIEQSGNFIN